ncbi:ubiquitin-like-specific protease 1D isoform X2 [Primulina tabacum]|uniref:ubiquitin-like-specific protease 1D isoform X2 n=1 Tax=Primulina tabacum TaxID=48773 RepID=UPI003F5A5E8C
MQKTVVLVDEEELETDVIDQVDQSIRDTNIYYPSRVDLKAIEIRYSDMRCLTPESYLSSTIMNFYIRYLQKPASSIATERCDYHFFNTYFYEKLKRMSYPSFLIGEWKYLSQERVPPEIPMAGKIWKKLSRRIVEKVIEVPQQRNEYDCGIFVLFFMERFLDKASDRLKTEDLKLILMADNQFDPLDIRSEMTVSRGVPTLGQHHRQHHQQTPTENPL